MPESIRPDQKLPVDFPIPPFEAKKDDSSLDLTLRIQKTVKISLYLIASAAALAVAGAICFLLNFSIAIAFVVGSVALATLGIAIGLNSIAHRLPPCIRKTIQAMHAVVTEIFSLAALIVLYPFGGFFKERIIENAPDQRPIIFVHGYLHNSSGWAYFLDQFEKAGFGQMHTVTLWHPWRPIEDYADMVKAKVQEIAEKTGRTDFIFIGHSMGGLAISEAALTMSNGVNVTNAFTICSPLKGTPVAKIGIGPNVRQMEVDSPFVQNLGSRILENEKNIRFFEVASCMDEIVPGKYALLGQVGRQLIVDDLGHAGIFFSSRIADWIIANLKTPV